MRATQALAALRKAANLQPSNFNFQLMLVQAYLNRRFVDVAVSHYQRALADASLAAGLSLDDFKERLIDQGYGPLIDHMAGQETAVRTRLASYNTSIIAKPNPVEHAALARRADLRNEAAWQNAPAWHDARVEPYVFLDGGKPHLVAQGGWPTLMGAGIGARAQWQYRNQTVSGEVLLGQALLQPASLGKKATVVLATLNWSR